MQPDEQTNTPASTPPAPTLAPEAPAPMDAWPGAFGLFKPSREAIRLNLKTLLLLLVISWGADIVISIALSHYKLLSDLLTALVGAFMSIAQIYAFLGSVRGKSVDLEESLKSAKPQWLQMFFLNILVGASVAAGFLLFIIPGLIIWPRLTLASYFLVDKKLGAVDAYKASWAATKGHSGKVWGITGVSILMVLPAITIIGVIATAYLLFMYQAALSLLYIYILSHPKGPVAEAQPAPPVAPATA